MQNFYAWSVSIGAHAAVLGVLFFYANDLFSHEKDKKTQTLCCDIRLAKQEIVEKESLPQSNNIQKSQIKENRDTPQPKKIDKEKEQDVVSQPIGEQKSADTSKNPGSLETKPKECEASHEIKPTQQKSASASVVSDDEKKRFLGLLRQTISKNIIYPVTARRRGVEGEVLVRFVLRADGTLGDIHVEGGNPIFHQSAINALSSTTVKPPSALALPLQITLTLSFKLDAPI